MFVATGQHSRRAIVPKGTSPGREGLLFLQGTNSTEWETTMRFKVKTRELRPGAARGHHHPGSLPKQPFGCPSASETLLRSGTGIGVQREQIHIVKDCSRYTGLPGGICTIHSFNIPEIPAGSIVSLFPGAECSWHRAGSTVWSSWMPETETERSGVALSISQSRLPEYAPSRAGRGRSLDSQPVSTPARGLFQRTRRYTPDTHNLGRALELRFAAR
jgi:hypothetical protein